MRTHATRLFVLLSIAGAAHAQAIDPAHSQIEFDLRSRLGTRVHGDFPTFNGTVSTLPDGRHQVHMRIATGDLRVGDSEDYAEAARGPKLFDAAHYPLIEFDSEPYGEALTRTGGILQGSLRMHGVQRREQFALVPAACPRAGHGCEILVLGRVSRGDYGLDGWRWLIADGVKFSLHVRLTDN